jgi:hypothetical protein
MGIAGAIYCWVIPPICAPNIIAAGFMGYYI